ncbi:uncharacterized protein V1518DRAFT_423078 [Limtongia smithiae]|uniref:uncharacterized protein n=1 Tax=Limtongia smithiae TaxID=1125753 RepID=UPI0034CE7B35
MPRPSGGGLITFLAVTRRSLYPRMRGSSAVALATEAAETASSASIAKACRIQIPRPSAVSPPPSSPPPPVPPLLPATPTPTSMLVPARAVSKIVSHAAESIASAMSETVHVLALRLDLLSHLTRLLTSVQSSASSSTSSTLCTTIAQRRRIFYKHHVRPDFSSFVARTLSTSGGNITRAEAVTLFKQRARRLFAQSELTKRQWRLYCILENRFGVDLSRIDIFKVRVNGLEMLSFVLRYPLASTVEVLPVAAAAMKRRYYPGFRDFKSSKFNSYMRTALSRTRKISRTQFLRRLSHRLARATHVPNVDSFNIIIRKLIVVQNVGLAAVLTFYALMDAGFEASPDVLVSLMKAAVDSGNAKVLELVLAIVIRQSQNDGIPNTALSAIFLNTHFISALMNASIKLKQPHIYNRFRQEFIRRKFHPTLETLTMELRYSFVTNNKNLAADVWKVLLFLDDLGYLRIDLMPLFWMAKFAQWNNNVKAISDIVRIAGDRGLLDKLVNKLKKDTG